MKKIFFQKCSLNYIFFLLHIIPFFLSIVIEVDYTGEENIYNISLQMINFYLSTLSNFLGIIPYFLLKKYSIRRDDRDDKALNENEKDNLLIYNNSDIHESFIKRKKIIIYSFLVAFFDFLSELTSILFYMIFPKLIMEIYDICCTVAFSVIIQFILSYFLLKIHFYKLQKFTLITNIIIFFILLTFDLINILAYQSFSGEAYGFFLLLYLFYAFEYTFVKKAFLEGFLSPYNLLILRGIFKTFIALLFSIIVLIIDKKIFIYMSFFFSNNIYILGLIGSLICKFFSDLFAWIIIDKFSPNYLPLCFIFEEICYFVSEAISSGQLNKFKTMGWDLYIRFFYI